MLIHCDKVLSHTNVVWQHAKSTLVYDTHIIQTKNAFYQIFISNFIQVKIEKANKGLEFFLFYFIIFF